MTLANLLSTAYVTFNRLYGITIKNITTNARPTQRNKLTRSFINRNTVWLNNIYWRKKNKM